MTTTTIFFSLNSVLIGVVGADVRATTQPLLATHGVIICSFLQAKLIHCIAVIVGDYIINPEGAPHNQANYIRLWSLIAFVSGFLSSLSLVTALVALSTGVIILSVAWIWEAIIDVLHQYGRSFLGACRWLYHEILKPFFKNIWDRYRGNNMPTENQQPRLPV